MEPLDFIQTPDEPAPETQNSGAVSKLTERIKSSKVEVNQKTSLVEKPAPDDNSQQIVGELNTLGKTVAEIKDILADFASMANMAFGAVKASNLLDKVMGSSKSPTSDIVDEGKDKDKSETDEDKTGKKNQDKTDKSLANKIQAAGMFGGKTSSEKSDKIPIDLKDDASSDLNGKNQENNFKEQQEQTKLLNESLKILQQIYKALKPDQLATQESEAETKKSIAEMLKTAVSDKKESDKKDSDADASKEEGGGFISSIMEMLGAKSLASKGLDLLTKGAGLGKNLLTSGLGLGRGLLTKGAGLAASAGSWLTGGLGLGGLMSSSAGAALSGGLGAGAAVGAGAGVAGAAIGGFKLGETISKKTGLSIEVWADEAKAMAEKAKKDAAKIKDPLGRAMFELSALEGQAESEIQKSKGGFFGGIKGIGELLGLSDGGGVATEETLKAIEEKKKEVAKLKAEHDKKKKQADKSPGGAQSQNTDESETDKSKRTREQQKYGYELDFVSEDEDDILADLKKENPDLEFDRWEIEHEKLTRSMENAKIKQDFEQNNPEHPEVVKMKKWREDYKKSTQGSSRGGEGVTSVPDQKSQPSKENKKLTPEQQWYGEIEGLESESYESIEQDFKNQGRVATGIGVDQERSKRQARNFKRKRDFEKNNPNDPRTIKARQEREDLQNMMPKGGAAGGEGASNLMPARDSNEKQATKTLSANTGMKLDEITNQNQRQVASITPTNVAIDNSTDSYVSAAQFRRSIQPEVGRMT